MIARRCTVNVGVRHHDEATITFPGQPGDGIILDLRLAFTGAAVA
jgi:hypothetical protein